MKDLSKLKKEIELKFGRVLKTPYNFDSLSLEIKKETGKEISLSTLKRIWGYVKYEHQPRQEILSILSQYLGYKDWSDFIKSEEGSDSSDFFSTGTITSQNLIGGEVIEIKWAPNRYCELQYLGGSKFKVIKSQNSKIKGGDEFKCNVIAKGEPMMCSSIFRGGELLSEGYIAAKRRGLHFVEIKNI